MIHPSYVDLMQAVNKDVEKGEEPLISSRYSIVMATAKTARQLIAGDEPQINTKGLMKPLGIAVEEINEGGVRILSEEEKEAELLRIKKELEAYEKEKLEKQEASEAEEA